MESNQPETSQPSLNSSVSTFEQTEKLRMEQNLLMAFVGGSAATLVGALVWAVVTVATGYQIGYMAIGVGFLAGYSVKFFGKGVDKIFGIVGAACALAGCVIGNFFSVIAASAHIEGIGYFEMLGIVDYTVVPFVMIDTFSPMDLLFYAIAMYEGYKFSFRSQE